MRKKVWITISIILLILLVSYVILNRTHQKISEITTRCIGGNSTLYVQLGCHACETQKEMFGKNSQYLNIIDCWYNREKCSEIKYTPTWIINGEKYVGVTSIDELKELTGCK